MSQIKVPSAQEVSPANAAIFANLQKQLGFVPNLYATIGYSDTALTDYLAFASRNHSLNNKEKEAIHLSVSQINQCSYCLAAHTAIAKMNGLSDDQILQIRRGQVDFDPKLHALVLAARELTEKRGHISSSTLENFLNAGYDKGSWIDLCTQVGAKIVANLVHSSTQIPVDFPTAPEL